MGWREVKCEVERKSFYSNYMCFAFFFDNLGKTAPELNFRGRQFLDFSTETFLGAIYLLFVRLHLVLSYLVGGNYWEG